MAKRKEMPNGSALTPRQECFAMEFVATGNAAEAYRRAYPRSRTWKENALYNRASKLLKHGEVVVRVEQLREMARDRHEVTIDSVVTEYNALIAKAYEFGQLGPAVTAITRKAELYGLLGKNQRQPNVDENKRAPEVIVIEIVDPREERDED